MKKIDVLVIGRSCLDNISIVEKFPIENNKAPLESRLIEAGGQGNTASCCILRLGGEVAYMGKVGDDDEGKFCVQRLIDFDVPIEYVEIIKNKNTPVAYLFITKSNGNRTIIYEPCNLPPISLNNKLKNLLKRSKTVLLDPETTYLAKPLKTFGNNDTQIIYDCERWRDGISDIMETADYFIPSSEFLTSPNLFSNNMSLTEKNFKLKDMIKGKLIVTDGGNGAYFFSESALFQVMPPTVKTLDTTGAGDNFHAAFALCVSREMDMLNAVKFSVAVASLSCTQYGGKNGIPLFEEAMKSADELEVKTISQF